MCTLAWPTKYSPGESTTQICIKKLQMSRVSNSPPADFSVGGKTFPACKQELCFHYHSSYRHTRKWFISLKPQRILGPLMSQFPYLLQPRKAEAHSLRRPDIPSECCTCSCSACRVAGKACRKSLPAISSVGTSASSKHQSKLYPFAVHFSGMASTAF